MGGHYARRVKPVFLAGRVPRVARGADFVSAVRARPRVDPGAGRRTRGQPEPRLYPSRSHGLLARSMTGLVPNHARLGYRHGRDVKQGQAPQGYSGIADSAESSEQAVSVNDGLPETLGLHPICPTTVIPRAEWRQILL